MLDNEDVQTVGPDEYPLYVEKDPVAPEEPVQEDTGKINSDTISGIKAVTAAVAGPNVIVATDETGKLPSSVIPATGWTLVETKTVTAATSTTFTGLSAAKKYHLMFSMTQNTANGFYSLQINGDGTANQHTNGWLSSAATGVGNSAGNGDVKIPVTSNASTVLATYWADGSAFISCDNRSTVRTHAYGSSSSLNAAGDYVSTFFAGSYVGTLSSLKLQTSAGTMTGTATLLSFTP